MDIHPPHEITSVKQFLLQLLTITIGILIALSLEGLLEWHHHRELVSDAEANLAHEIEDNKKELDGALQNAPAVRADLERALGIYSAALKHQKLDVHNIKLSYGVVDLRAASWETARATGATSYMDYPTVKEYDEVYELQQELMHIQDDLLTTLITSIPAQDPFDLTDPELLAGKENLQKTLAYLSTGENIARALSTEYQKALTSTHH